MLSTSYTVIPERLASAFPDLQAAYDKEVAFYAPNSVPPTVFVEDEFIPYVVRQPRNGPWFIRALCFLEELAESDDEAILDLLCTSVAAPLIADAAAFDSVAKAAGPGLRAILFRVRATL